MAGACRGRNHRRENQKGLLHADPNSNPAQEEKIDDSKEGIDLSFAQRIAQKETRLSLAECVAEIEKEIVAHTGAKRNAIANRNAISVTKYHRYP